MNLSYKLILIIHIASGFTALAAGLIAILSKKGRRIHRKAGTIFFYSMITVAASAIYISIIKKNEFLLLIAVFALYQNCSGYRSIQNKKLKPSFLDWLSLIIVSVNSFFMIYSMNIILIVLGTLSSSVVIGTLRIFILTLKGVEIPKLQWLALHIRMMLGAYIATVTAFVVVNVKNVNPAWAPWLLPTFIGTPLILYWIRKYTSSNKPRS